MLINKHMKFAQALIKKQFHNLSGHQCTLTVSQLQAPMVSKNVLPILYIGFDHWVVASNIGCTSGEVRNFMIHFTVTFLMQLKCSLERCWKCQDYIDRMLKTNRQLPYSGFLHGAIFS